MDMYGNYKAYRDLLISTTPPFIPFLGMSTSSYTSHSITHTYFTQTLVLFGSGLFLSDLTFIDDGNPSFAKKNQLNLMKRRLTAEVMVSSPPSPSLPSFRPPSLFVFIWFFPLPLPPCPSSILTSSHPLSPSYLLVIC